MSVMLVSGNLSPEVVILLVVAVGPSGYSTLDPGSGSQKVGR